MWQNKNLSDVKNGRWQRTDGRCFYTIKVISIYLPFVLSFSKNRFGSNVLRMTISMAVKSVQRYNKNIHLSIQNNSL
jgi:hypothetical protein